MPRKEYRYEVEARRLIAGQCPQCERDLVYYPKNKFYLCVPCRINFAEKDYHREAGWAVLREKKDERPTIQAPA